MNEKIESIKVIDIHGREILRKPPQSKHFTLNISHLLQGNYILFAESISKRYLARITKK